MLSFLVPMIGLAAALSGAQADAPAEALTHDTRGRPVVQVRIDDRGPFPMVVDTAAQTSLIVSGLAEELRLSPAEETIGVNGATGQEAAALYPVKRFASGLFDRRNVSLVGLPNVGATDARGIIGIDAFGGARLLFDRTAARVALLPSGPSPAGFVAHKGRLRANGFVEVPVALNGTIVAALVDSGAARTSANAAALRLMGWKTDDPRLRPGGQIRGATATGQKVAIGRIDRFTLGPVTLRDVPLLFSVPAVNDDGRGEAPTIILGSDLLNLFPAYAVDFTRAELQIRMTT